MAPQPRYQPGHLIGGRHQVHKALAGGMGEVYLCLDLETGLPFAFKTLQTRFVTDLTLRAAFEHEVATWVALERHPNIVRCHYLQIIDNLPFLVMEWVEGDEVRGGDLRSWLLRGLLDLRQALIVAIDICQGLVHADRKQPGIVHCDLKPENVLIDQTHVAKITDFGLARVVQQATPAYDFDSSTDRAVNPGGAPDVNGVAGTPPYMAPEQWLAQTLDARTDIYALGCILYEMVSGRRLFPGPTWTDFRRQHLDSSALRIVAMDWPAGLLNVLERCLARDPGQRFATAAETLAALQELFVGHLRETPPVRAATDEYNDNDYSNRGATFVQMNRYEQALADFDRAITLSPDTARYYANRAIAQLGLQRMEQSFADLHRAIELDPNAPITYNQLGNTYSEVGQRQQAIAAYTQAIVLEPGYANAYYNRGNTYARLDQLENAIADYSRAIELNPAHAKAYADRGLALRKLGRHIEALADLERAIQLDPAYSLAFSNRAQTYHALGQYAAAVRDFTQAVRLDPANADAYDGRGLAYEELGRITEALADFAQAIELNSTRTQPRFNRGLLHQRLQHHEQAVADFTSVIELDPTDAQAYNMRGNAYRALERYDAALADFAQAIALDAAYPKPYFNRGLVYFDQGKPSAAFADFVRTTELEPSYAPAYLNLGVILVIAKQWQGALRAFEQARALGMPEAEGYIERVQAEMAQTATEGKRRRRTGKKGAAMEGA